AYEVFQTCMAKLQEQQATANKEKSKEFLKKNAMEKGVCQTASGLQYQVITEGTGEKPASTSTVSVNYEGKLLDGTVFDSSIKRGTPAQFPVDKVIKGWTEGLQLMSVGSKYRFWIPSDLAYGDNGAGGIIKPGELLVFDVELLKIVKEEPKEATPAAEATSTQEAAPAKEATTAKAAKTAKASATKAAPAKKAASKK
ncbi:MAG: FKBP-type peptidyl-prolyl cis-trans isomerase, partial [Bacteroidota bacterium]|nr:FKBP-type peptidyl-prolyl cis-trans isomerase [Bacteroidota bacterium]